MTGKIVVFGAAGHTGQFVVGELVARGLRPVLVGRNVAKVALVSQAHGGLERAIASADDVDALDKALTGAAVVINCAGPFADTAPAVIEAALRTGTDYVDIAAEVEANLDSFSQYNDRARQAGIRIVPAMAFFGGLADLLVTIVARDWAKIDVLSIAYGLDSWQPTVGTLAAGRKSRERRDGRRILFQDGRHQYRDDAAPTSEWRFAEPLGLQPVVAEFTTADSVTIPRHIDVGAFQSYMTSVAVRDLVDPQSAAPVAVDASGRSAQRFIVEVVARSGDEERNASASGQDIYAITAPLVAEAVERLLSSAPGASGVYSPGEIFDAADLLRTLSPQHLSLNFLPKGDHDDLAA